MNSSKFISFFKVHVRKGVWKYYSKNYSYNLGKIRSKSCLMNFHLCLLSKNYVNFASKKMSKNVQKLHIKLVIHFTINRFFCLFLLTLYWIFLFTWLKMSSSIIFITLIIRASRRKFQFENKVSSCNSRLLLAAWWWIRRHVQLL